MELKGFIKKKQDLLLSGLFVLMPVLLLTIQFDFYYDLNDDVLMKDILAGNYTGVPEGHNIQMLWIISAGISLLYRVCGAIPWYGLFLCVCQFGALWVILKQSFSVCRRLKSKLLIGFVETLVFTVMMMEHLVAVQYTITCTMLAAAAAFRFLTTDRGLPVKAFIRYNIPSVLLVFLAFLIRSEMLILVLPMICVAGVVKWSFEGEAFTKENFTKYLWVFGLILLGLGIGQGTHELAYHTADWQRFTELFDNRTELYDFQKPPSYEENKEFYDQIGIAQSEQILFENYNFGIDEEIDETVMGQIADYAGSLNREEQPFADKLQEYLKLYVYRLHGGSNDAGSDYPWNYMTALMYLTVFLFAMCQGWRREDGQDGDIWRERLKTAFSMIWKLLFLFAVRSALWMYILLGERFPDRITHSLYFMELVVLAGIMFAVMSEKKGHGRTQLVRMTMLICFGLLSVLLIPEKLQAVAADQVYRAQTNKPYLDLYEYFAEHPDNFYFIDVYSSVSYSEKMFKNVDHTLDNYDIMGGWANKSPLYRKKLATFGIPDMEQGLLSMEQVYFVKKETEDMDWLFSYYEDHGTPVTATLIDTVDDAFEVYAVESAER